MNMPSHAFGTTRRHRRLPTMAGQALQALVWTLLAALAATLWNQAHAAQPGNNAPADALKLYLEQATNGLPGRVEVVVGQLDERLQLAPCGRIEPYIPAGTRLWGRTRLGLKCLEGASWNVYLPVEIRVFGQALVANRPIAYGQAAAGDDVRIEEVELSRESGVALSDPASVDGKTATRGIAAGQVLRAEYFRTPPAVGAGDTVRLVFSGEGFSVSSSGRALSAAQEGQPVRVQTEFGRVVQGIARAGRLVEMRL